MPFQEWAVIGTQEQNKGCLKCQNHCQDLGIGFDQLPEAIRTSKLLTGNDLAMLANVEVLPKGAKAIVNLEQHVAQEAQKRLALDDVQGAWELLIKQ